MKKGFTLIEVQVSLVILLTALFGIKIIINSYLKQLQSIEKKDQLLTIVSTDLKRIIFTEQYKDGESLKKYEVNITTMTKTNETFKASVTLEAV
jgi:prepilin-type N-terminal cleavage/methylation domain-containing protein